MKLENIWVLHHIHLGFWKFTAAAVGGISEWSPCPLVFCLSWQNQWLFQVKNFQQVKVVPHTNPLTMKMVGEQCTEGGGSVVGDGRVLMDWNSVKLKNFDPGPQIPPPSSLPRDCELGLSHCYLMFMLICCRAPPISNLKIYKVWKKVVWGIAMTMTIYFQKQALCQK